MPESHNIRRWTVNRKKSYYHLVFGVPIAAILLVPVWFVVQWAGFPLGVFVAIVLIELFVFIVDALNIVILTLYIRRAKQ